MAVRFSRSQASDQWAGRGWQTAPRLTGTPWPQTSLHTPPPEIVAERRRRKKNPKLETTRSDQPGKLSAGEFDAPLPHWPPDSSPIMPKPTISRCRPRRTVRMPATERPPPVRWIRDQPDRSSSVGNTSPQRCTKPSVSKAPTSPNSPGKAPRSTSRSPAHYADTPRSYQVELPIPRHNE